MFFCRIYPTISYWSNRCLEKLEELKKWKKADVAAQKVTVTSGSKKVLLTIVSCKTSNEVMNSLEAFYGQKSDQSLHVLEQRFFVATFDRSDRVAVHVLKLANLTKEMTVLGETISEKIVISKILNMLPEEFKHFHERTPEGLRRQHNLYG